MITSVPFPRRGARHEGAAWAAGFAQPRAAAAADARRGVPDLRSWCARATACARIDDAVEGSLAHRIECAALSGNGDRVASASFDRLGTGFRTAFSCALMGSGLADQAGARHCRSDAGLDG